VSALTDRSVRMVCAHEICYTSEKRTVVSLSSGDVTAHSRRHGRGLPVGHPIENPPDPRDEGIYHAAGGILLHVGGAGSSSSALLPSPCIFCSRSGVEEQRSSEGSLSDHQEPCLPGPVVLFFACFQRRLPGSAPLPVAGREDKPDVGRATAVRLLAFGDVNLARRLGQRLVEGDTLLSVWRASKTPFSTYDIVFRDSSIQHIRSSMGRTEDPESRCGFHPLLPRRHVHSTRAGITVGFLTFPPTTTRWISGCAHCVRPLRFWIVQAWHMQELLSMRQLSTAPQS